MNQQLLIKNATRVVFLIALIVALLFVITFTGIIKCNQFPVIGGAWCNAYWAIKAFTTGAPRVLIVYGESGLGNPIDEGGLRDLLSNPEILNVHADIMDVGRVTIGTLRNYDLVIVERAKKINTTQLRAFIDYATGPTGGTLIWTGDAGTEPGESYVGGKTVKDQLLYTTERDPTADANEPIGPWARKEGDLMISFDQLLGVQYLGKNFCQAVECSTDAPSLAGNIETEPTGSHPLIRGIGRTLPLYVFKDEDLALVEAMSGGITTEVLALNFGSNLVKAGLDKSVPLIVTAGLGERVIYYAMPPEYYANPKLTAAGKGTYLLPVENMYWGPLKG
jgi:hypothetical protein